MTPYLEFFILLCTIENMSETPAAEMGAVVDVDKVRLCEEAQKNLKRLIDFVRTADQRSTIERGNTANREEKGVEGKGLRGAIDKFTKPRINEITSERYKIVGAIPQMKDGKEREIKMTRVDRSIQQNGQETTKTSTLSITGLTENRVVIHLDKSGAFVSAKEYVRGGNGNGEEKEIGLNLERVNEMLKEIKAIEIDEVLKRQLEREIENAVLRCFQEAGGDIKKIPEQKLPEGVDPKKIGYGSGEGDKAVDYYRVQVGGETKYYEVHSGQEHVMREMDVLRSAVGRELVRDAEEWAKKEAMGETGEEPPNFFGDLFGGSAAGEAQGDVGPQKSEKDGNGAVEDVVLAEERGGVDSHKSGKDGNTEAGPEELRDNLSSEAKGDTG